MAKSIGFRKSEFIRKSNEKFNNKFDYSKVEYKDNSTNITIICPIHGEFQQSPRSHLYSSHGCPKCGRIYTEKSLKSNTDRFIEKSKQIHGDYYDYSKVEYVNQFNKVKIICPIHGEFLQSPKKHLSGCKCKRCNKRKSDDEIIQKINDVHGDKYSYGKFNYKNQLEKIRIICPIHGEFFTSLNNHLSKGCGCPKCASTASKYENYVEKYLKGYNVKYISRYRKITKPKELDFYLPDHKIAIEINGLYWHSELAEKDKTYHLNKSKLCEEKGIKLIHINENEFINSLPIVKSKLNSILNINKYPIYARKCIVKEIDTSLKSKFLNKYHLQGNDKATVKLGLFYNNKLVSVMTFCKRRIALGKNKSEEGEYELSRYCGNFSFYVIGGASKLLKYFERNYNPKKIITYADKRWSQGDLYFKLGFKHTHDSSPNYWYFKEKSNNVYYIYHRFNFRKSKLSKKLETFDPNKTEWENMKENGWNRIWDCGNMVFEKIY